MNGEDHRQALRPGFRLGSYRVVDVLGVGGFGVTYLCEHTGLGHQVAVKEYLPNEFAMREGATVHPKSSSDRESFQWGLSRFVDEAHMLTRFRHPNLVRVSDYFEANDTAYIVMDYEDGEPLDVLLKRHGTLTEAQLKRVLLPVADGLRLVHAAGFLHRDIKPSNIFVRRADESPVLLDFGSARQALWRKSRSMTAIASAGYSPPEQYESQGAQGPWTDIYALSALCHRAITGETPMEAPRRQSQLLRSQVDPLPKLAEAGVAGYSPAFLEAVDRGLRVIETERPQTLDDWLAWMDDAASVKPSLPSKSATRPKRGKAAGKRADGPMPPEASAHPRAPKSSGFNAKVGVLAGAAAAVIGVGLYFALVDWMQFTAGDRFWDCAECPEMVVVPAGSFLMGSPGTEEGRFDEEGPVHQVTIDAPFAVGVYEVTFAEWDACASSGGCGERQPLDNGWGRGRRPVINVSWDDAKSYVQWLSSRTGQRYRLLSESEWEYMARAGTQTPFHMGGTISTDQANYRGDYGYGSGREGGYRGQPVPAGSFPPNAWGLHDVHGNVWEWVEDCWNGSYAGAPTDGGAWERGDCSRRVCRGGAWGVGPRHLRSAGRFRDAAGSRDSLGGFRVARTLTP